MIYSGAVACIYRIWSSSTSIAPAQEMVVTVDTKTTFTVDPDRTIDVMGREISVRRNGGSDNSLCRYMLVGIPS